MFKKCFYQLTYTPDYFLYEIYYGLDNKNKPIGNFWNLNEFLVVIESKPMTQDQKLFLTTPSHDQVLQ